MAFQKKAVTENGEAVKFKKLKVYTNTISTLNLNLNP